jgi:hypothetical protein
MEGYSANLLPDGISGDGGRQVIVRNTFIDIQDDVPPEPALLRGATTGGRLERNRVDDSDDEAGTEIDTDYEPEIPAEPSLYRFVTVESQEAYTYWNMNTDTIRNEDAYRQNSTPQQIQQGQEVQQVQQVVPMTAAFQAGFVAPACPGMMMVPMGMFQTGGPIVVGAGTLNGMPPGCVAMPVDPYARWPVSNVYQQQQLLAIINSEDDYATRSAEILAQRPAAEFWSNSGAKLPVGDAEAESGERRRQLVIDGVGISGLFPIEVRAPREEPLPATQEVLDDPSVAPPPQGLTRGFSVSSGIYRVHWSVENKKLKSGDKVAVSPAFPISLNGQDVPFKMLIHPTVMGDGKGCSAFRKSKGKGKIELKCEGMFDQGTEAWACYRISVSSGNPQEPEKKQKPRGPVRHNFANSGVSGLAKGEEEWEFSASVDTKAQVFVVVLEFLGK